MAVLEIKGEIGTEFTALDFKAWLKEKPTLAQQWKEANAPAPVIAPTAIPAVAVDTTKVLAQVIK